MNSIKSIWALFALGVMFPFVGNSQNGPKKLVPGWHLMDNEKDSVYGISLQKAYDLLKHRKSNTVVVAIIDSGIDTAHEDLRDVLWKNSKEIPGNGIDDDKNGYVDDIHGWNFIGGKDGKNVGDDSFEFIRVYERFRNKYELADSNSIMEANKAQYSMWFDAKRKIGALLSSIKDTSEAKKQYAQASYNFRAAVVRDNEGDINDRYYGNNDVMALGPVHCTHVAGIIAANRNNNKGINGIADNVRIMAIRAIPNGDEHDKDVACAIRYAADNGASIINMSFNKDVSPDKRWVDEAVKYATAKGVLFVHAAGNDAVDLDRISSFPNPFLEQSGTQLTNWITVGATINGAVAPFSNYGKKTVDVFSPGFAIYSSLPGNQYGNMEGTSMACPIVTGLAALILSYYPKLTAAEIKTVIQKSVTIPPGPCKKPGTQDMVHLSDISKTGGIINAYNAVKLAGEMEKGSRGKSAVK